MAKSPGLFDVDERLRRLSDIGDQLEAYASVFDFEMFQPDLEKALAYSDSTNGGRPPYDPVMMFRILNIQAQNGLGDDRAEFLINDRPSFMRFLALGLSHLVWESDTKRVWRHFGEREGDYVRMPFFAHQAEPKTFRIGLACALSRTAQLRHHIN